MVKLTLHYDKKWPKIHFGWPNQKLLHLLLFKNSLEVINIKKKDIWVLFIEVSRVKNFYSK